MQLTQLQSLYENREHGESLNDTLARLQQEPEKTEVNEPVTPSDAVSSYGEELTIPRYKILQPSCQIEGATPGCFRNSLTEEEVEKLENVVLLTRQDTRSYFADGDFSGQKSCWSHNGYVPATKQIKSKTDQDPVAPMCARRDEKGKLVFCCPLAQWRNAKTGQIDPKGTKPPTCKASVKFLGLELNSQLSFWIVFHGSSLPIVKNFLRIVNYKRKGVQRQGDNLQLYHFRIDISLKQQTTSKGRFFVPLFEQKEVITDPEERVLLHKAYEYYKDWFLAESAEIQEIE